MIWKRSHFSVEEGRENNPQQNLGAMVVYLYQDVGGEAYDILTCNTVAERVHPNRDLRGGEGGGRSSAQLPRLSAKFSACRAACRIARKSVAAFVRKPSISSSTEFSTGGFGVAAKNKLYHSGCDAKAAAFW